MKNEFIENYLAWLRENVFVNEIEEGKKWVINTPFLDRHNDYLEIYIVKKDEDSYILTDDGFIYSDLITSGCEPSSPKRKELFKLNVVGLGISFNERTKELFVETDFQNIGRRKHKLAQAMLAIGDMFMLASPNISTIFKEDVKNYFRRREIPFNYDFKVSGKSLIEHNIEIALPTIKEKPETMIKVINNPSMGYAKNAIFTFIDITETRKIHSVVIYNDEGEKKIAKGFIQALKSYNIKSIPWSKRDKYSERILKEYQKLK